VLTSIRKQKVRHKLIQEIPNLLAIYLLGSQIQRTTHKDSDTDPGILLESRVDPSLAFAIKSDLSLIVGGDGDLIDLDVVEAVIQKHLKDFVIFCTMALKL